MTSAVVFAYHNVGVAAMPRWAQPWCGHGEPDANILHLESGR